MIGRSLRWLCHWIGQGLKLWLFSLVASICLLPLYLPLALLEEAAYHSDNSGVIVKIGIVLGNLVCGAVMLAVFTAVLASQLRDNPLRPFKQRPKPLADGPCSPEAAAETQQ